MICFIENNILQDYHRSLHVTCFVLRFLLRKFFKTVGELLHLLPVHPKLIFRGVLKKAVMVPEDRSYQTQHFAKILPMKMRFE